MSTGQEGVKAMSNPSESNSTPAFPEMPCACLIEEDQRNGSCMCMQAERALRHIAAGNGPPMTAEQRAWCIREVVSVEGYSESDANEQTTDKDLAHNVLCAWVDYCRDKGMLA